MCLAGFVARDRAGLKVNPRLGYAKLAELPLRVRRLLLSPELIFGVVVELLDKLSCQADSEETEITETGRDLNCILHQINMY